MPPSTQPSKQHPQELIHQLEERVAELEQQLEQAERLASAGLTMAGMAHSIKNILGGLEGGVYVVNSGIKSENLDRTKGGWEMVQQYIDQLTVLVQNLLRYAKPDKPARELVEPGVLAKDVCQLFESKAELVNVAVECRVEQGLEPLSLDRPGMHACLTNLVSNALDACMLDPDDEKQHRIVILVSPTPDRGVIFEVQDNGMGIAEEDQQKILSAFFTTKGIRGTGLGLLLTKKTVEEHGGKISFFSTPGQGATFQLELPR